MQEEIEGLLKQIRNIWNSAIWDHQFYYKKIKHNSDIRTNYFGEILGYFEDTLDIVFSDEYNTIQDNHSARFSYSISLLQAIYVQQDFVEELLSIFKTGIDKGDLKKEVSYTINRELRNELVGHPVRKLLQETGEYQTHQCSNCDIKIDKPIRKEALVSTTLFSYQGAKDEIKYLRYSRENNFKVEIMSHKIIDIQERHFKYLANFLKKVISSTLPLIKKHRKQLDSLISQIKKKKLDSVIDMTDHYFESFFETDHLYTPKHLLELNSKQEENFRYKYSLDLFYKDLEESINDFIINIDEIINPGKKELQSSIKASPIEINFFNNIEELDQIKKDVVEKDFNYEISKFYSKRNSQDFSFFSSSVLSRTDNKIVIDEIHHMSNNISNVLEYYSALNVVVKELINR